MTEPNTFDAPVHVAAERAVLGEILRTGSVAPDIAELVTPTDFGRPQHEAVAETCWDLTARDLPCDTLAVRSELLRRGDRGQASDAVFLFDLLQAALPSPAYHARQIRDTAVRRHVLATATRLLDAARDPETDPYDLAASLAVQLSALSERADPAVHVAATDAPTFLAGPTEYDWAVPDLLERGDRWLVTGGEGSGKSVCTRQIAVAASHGVHPFTATRFAPLRVLLVDLENGTRHLRRALRPMWDLAERTGSSGGALYVESRPSGIDLMDPRDEQWLRGLCESTQPQLMVIGPLYRMHSGDMAKEEAARHLTAVLDSIRARYECALVIETHAPHGSGIGARDLRPVGSSLFRRWPEFGYGIRPSNDKDVWDFVSWRGPRDERTWPRQLKRGGPGAWPWRSADDNPTDEWWKRVTEEAPHA